ncbi:GTP-binding protein [Thermobifida halotolerans]|uniref:GTP-binding protein n=1 Tax=Thermobifida halotolerans TaxID=483545 RepID=A0A399G8S4_9ACTN|nr:GTP-binding protein [Thermobifida halotolerans]UOE21934.1 GTP-binding protein [Thermobifida halotolerans]
MNVVVVSGLHRRARQRTVELLLHTVPRSVAVHHDLTEIGAGRVRRVLRDRWNVLDAEAVPLVHACVSCTLREDLLPALLALAERGEHALCVVDAWDGVEPQPVAEALVHTVVDGRPVDGRLRLAAVVTAVDSARLVSDLSCPDDLSERGLGAAPGDERTVAEVLARQIEYPSTLVLHEAADPAHDEDSLPLLEQLNPAAAVLPPQVRALTPLPSGRFDTAAAAARVDPVSAQYPDSCADGRVRTVTWRRHRPLHPGRLHAALDEVVGSSLRSRGRFWLASRPDTVLVWDAGGDALAVEAAGPWLASLPPAARELASQRRRASAEVDWHPDTGDRGQCLCFTGVDLDVAHLTAVLDSCLLTDAELREGERVWTAAEDPFAHALDSPVS